MKHSKLISAKSPAFSRFFSSSYHQTLMFISCISECCWKSSGLVKSLETAEKGRNSLRKLLSSIGTNYRKHCKRHQMKGGKTISINFSLANCHNGTPSDCHRRASRETLYNLQNFSFAKSTILIVLVGIVLTRNLGRILVLGVVIRSESRLLSQLCSWA